MIAAGMGAWAQTENFTTFNQISEYKRLVPAHPLHDFTKFSKFTGSCLLGHMLKLGGEFGQRVAELRGLKFEGSCSPIYSAPLASTLYVGSLNVLQV